MAVSYLQGAGRNNSEQQVRMMNWTDGYHWLTCGLSAWSIKSKIFWLDGNMEGVGGCKIGELSQFLVVMNYTDNTPNLWFLSPQSMSLCKIFWLNGDAFGDKIDIFEQRPYMPLQLGVEWMSKSRSSAESHRECQFTSGNNRIPQQLKYKLATRKHDSEKIPMVGLQQVVYWALFLKGESW